jgi:hypothetical protein
MLETLANYVVSLFKKIPVNYRFIALAVMAFLSAISFMQIDSFFADRHHINWLFWTVGIFFGAVVLLIVKWGLDEMKRIRK